MRRAHLTLILTVVLVIPGTVTASDDSQPNFSGTWLLNQDLSDQIQSPSPRSGGPQGDSRGGGGRGGGGGGGGRGGGMKQGRQNQQPPAQDQNKILRLKQEISRLEIFHEAAELNITSGQDITRLFYTDGRTTSLLTERGQAAATATWQARTLIIQWQNDQGGPGRSQSFELSDDGQRLTVTEHHPLPAGDKPRKMNLVYDKQE